ncbi:hypothetical protein BHM03_00059856 [Ensete ventricosum]|nr:hypothetical protein BHM03_00059856 [Ensete ventricosum]
MPTCSVLTTVLFLISDPNKRRQYDRKGFHGIQDYNVIISIFLLLSCIIISGVH